jgi:hypothetical protein
MVVQAKPKSASIQLAPPMTVPDLTGPIPAGTFRISVQWGDDRLFITDIPSANVAGTVLAFEEYVGPALALGDNRHSSHAANGCTAVAGIAAKDGDSGPVTAALWLFLFEPDADRSRKSDRLGEMIDGDGSALLAAVTDPMGIEWRFGLYEMPRWPAAAMQEAPEGWQRL